MREPVHISQIVQELDRQNLLPAIVFRSSRSQCDLDAERAGKNPRLKLSPPAQRELRQRVHEISEMYEMDPELITSHPHYNALITTGIGAHHAGQLLMWRLLLEELMSFGLLRALVATGTVAAGVDFPARTVVITAHSKRGADGFRPLTSAEFQQMSGRAGRRGKDTVGFCIAAPSQFCDARALLKISKQPPEPLVSAYFPGPSTVLNLLRYRTVDGLRYTVERSLAGFIDRKEAKTLREQACEESKILPAELREAMLKENENGLTFVEPNGQTIQQLTKDQKRHVKKTRRLFREAGLLESRQMSMLDASLTGLQELGYLEGLHLSDKGTWAANLCTSLVLELGEMIESDIFKDASAEVLVAVIAAVSGDTHRQYLHTKNQPLSREQVEKIEEILMRVGALNMPGVTETRAVNQAAANTALTWLQCEDWQQFRGLLALSDVAEGDAARLITQTAEQLNQITRLGATHQALSLRAEEGKRRLLRPPLTEALNLDTV
ncbi:MAG: hypothetical protein U0136_03330 [Bdellovibrionota bacterium]